MSEPEGRATQAVQHEPEGRATQAVQHEPEGRATQAVQHEPEGRATQPVQPVQHQVVLVRHGETAWTVTGQHTSRSDVPLTEEGRRQALKLASLLAGFQFARVLTSPLSRAWETCRLAGLAARAEPCEDLREWDYGDYEGCRTSDIRTRTPAWTLWDDGVPNGETIDEVTRRADRVVAAVRATEGDVALFSHGHLLRVLAARWVGLAAADGRRFALAPGTVSRLGWEREIPVLVTWNQGE